MQARRPGRAFNSGSRAGSDCWQTMTIADLNQLILSQRKCGSCPMLGKTFVGADSLSGHDGPVDVLFMGLNPGAEEARAALPFVGPSGKFLRMAIGLAPDYGSWAMTNSILCSTRNETAIPDPNICRTCCRANVAMIWRRFSPRVTVPCGNGASAMFEIKDGITRAESLWYISRGRAGKAPPAVVAPIQHPSALIRSGGKSSPKYAGWQARINAIFRIAKLLQNGAGPEDVLAENGISWRGLFGLHGKIQ